MVRDRRSAGSRTGVLVDRSRVLRSLFRHRSLLVDVTPQSRGEKQRAHRGGRDGGPQPSPQAATGSEAVTRMLAAVGRRGDRVGDARETFLCVSQRSQKYDGPYLGR